MKRLKLIVIYSTVFAGLLLFFTPKIYCYYALEKQIEQFNVRIAQERADDGGFWLTVSHGKLYYDDLYVGTFEQLSILPLLLYNHAKVENLSISKEMSRFATGTVDTVNVQHYIVSPWTLYITAHADMGDVTAQVHLKDKIISLLLEPSEALLKQAPFWLRQLKKTEEGGTHMKQLMSNEWIQRLFVVLILAAVAKALSLALMFWLPHQGVDVIVNEQKNIFNNYRPSAMLNITKKKKELPQSEPVYALTSLTLKAIYDDPLEPFIAVEDAGKVSLISLDEKFKGYRLIDVQEDRAVFEKSGKNYELKFKASSASSGSISDVEVDEFEFLEEEGGAAVFIKRQQLQKYAKNPNEIFRNIKIKEIVENKRLKGFKVMSVKKNSIFGQLGLQKGDIITGANNREFRSVSQVFKLYNNIDSLDNLILHVTRGNEEKDLEYEIYE